MKKIIIIITALLGLTNLAGAESLNDAFTGRYVDSGFLIINNIPNPEQYGKIFTVRAKGNRLLVEDEKTEIKYLFNLNTKQEQDLPEEYMERFRNKVGTRAIYKASISNIQISNGGKKLSTDLNYYIGYDSPFGRIELIKISLPLSATIKEECEVFPGFTQKIECIEIKKGFGAGVRSVKTNLGTTADNTIGLLLDLTIKALYPSISLTQPALFKVKQ